MILALCQQSVSGLLRPLFFMESKSPMVEQNEQKAFIDRKRIKIHNIYFNSHLRYDDKKGWKWDTNTLMKAYTT